jgi:hypothetical protein
MKFPHSLMSILFQYKNSRDKKLDKTITDITLDQFIQKYRYECKLIFREIPQPLILNL